MGAIRRYHGVDWSGTVFGQRLVTASNQSSADYRGGAGNDTLIAGSQSTTWLYSGAKNGFDTFVNGGGGSTAFAETFSPWMMYKISTSV